MPTIIPAANSEAVRELCERLAPGGVPVRVPIRVAEGALPRECFPNVRHMVERWGGEILYGWAITEWVEVLTEAEFHAVWRSPAEELIDVTPSELEHKETLFLADPVRTWSGKQIDNERVPHFESGLFADLDAIAKRLVEEQKRPTDRPGFYADGETVSQLQELREGVVLLLGMRASVRVECPCGSGKRYKECHRAELYRLVERKRARGEI